MIDENEFETNAETSPLTKLSELRHVLSRDEEYTFMQLLFSSSARVRVDNFGQPRKEVMRMLGLKNDDLDGFQSFLKRINGALTGYFQCIYDERRDQVVVLMRVPARQARSVLSSESLGMLMFIFYHQEVLQNEFTLFNQLLTALGHETLQARRKIQANLEPLLKIGAITKYESSSNEEAYVLTAIGSRMFSNSFLHRSAEFSQSQQLHMDDVLKFFKRYNVGGEEL
ncbi:hypothetical protein [Bacillus manliponensis]|uniref:hypothetical protein n=1 Tax=Bacillus manliponensis TaxID=574376 RepID=UPI0035144C00